VAPPESGSDEAELAILKSLYLLNDKSAAGDGKAILLFVQIVLLAPGPSPDFAQSGTNPSKPRSILVGGPPGSPITGI
jgi:hypothetical protein